MAPGQLLYDLWWEDRKQTEWLWLHCKICIARKVRASAFPRAVFFVLEKTIQILNVHNNLTHCFMEKPKSQL